MKSYPTVRKLAHSSKEAIRFCAELYPGSEPVLIRSEISDYASKMFYTIEIRPKSQKKLLSFGGGVPHGTE